MDKKERVAKWLASVIENGEPYDDFDKMDWGEFAGGEEMKGAFLELAAQLLGLLGEIDKKWERVARGTAEAIKTVTQKYYADCFNTEADMRRLMLWETNLRKMFNA